MITKKRKLIEVFPKSWRNLWNLWEIRVTVLLSLFLQGTLFLLGNRRKFSTSNKLRIILWLAYTAADSVATVALSILSTNSGSYVDGSADPSFMITAFWAPFLLLHLGGPDTISAYSLEDNELWLRRLLQLVVQSIVAAYVFISAWNWKSTNALNFMAIPMLIAGIIKSGERTWTLWQGSSNRFQDSLLRESDPGPNYARYMEEYKSKKEEGFDVSLGELIDVPIEVNDFDAGEAEGSYDDEVDILSYANRFFDNFKQLFANLILSFEDIKESKNLFTRESFSYDKAFKMIEVELGFAYDLFYTKTVLLDSLAGVVLRFISLSCTAAVLWAFCIIKKDGYPAIDVIITYVLLVGAIILEIYAVFVQLSSDWMMLRLGIISKYKNLKQLNAAASSNLKSRQRWSNTMGQHNLITICLNRKPTKCSTIQKKLSIYTFLEKYRYKGTVIVQDKLKEMIFEDLKLKVKDNSEFKLCGCRGDLVLRNERVHDEIIEWSVKVEFDQSILLWHIATDLCYYADLSKSSNNVNGRSNCEARPSRMLSHYMLYLLVMCPFLLPNGIGQIRLRDTRDEASEFFREASRKLNENDACMMLPEVCTDIPPLKVKGDRSKSVLFDGCRLAKSLESPKIENKWKLIRRVWVEMLSYAACQCQWSDHAQQLRRGGELLTHVWLLMAHFGITEQLRISQGHARTKLMAR